MKQPKTKVTADQPARRIKYEPLPDGKLRLHLPSGDYYVELSGGDAENALMYLEVCGELYTA